MDPIPPPPPPNNAPLNGNGQQNIRYADYSRVQQSPVPHRVNPQANGRGFTYTRNPPPSNGHAAINPSLLRVPDDMVQYLTPEQEMPTNMPAQPHQQPTRRRRQANAPATADMSQQHPPVTGSGAQNAPSSAGDAAPPFPPVQEPRHNNDAVHQAPSAASFYPARSAQPANPYPHPPPAGPSQTPLFNNGINFSTPAFTAPPHNTIPNLSDVPPPPPTMFFNSTGLRREPINVQISPMDRVEELSTDAETGSPTIINPAPLTSGPTAGSTRRRPQNRRQSARHGDGTPTTTGPTIEALPTASGEMGRGAWGLFGRRRPESNRVNATSVRSRRLDNPTAHTAHRQDRQAPRRATVASVASDASARSPRTREERAERSGNGGAARESLPAREQQYRQQPSHQHRSRTGQRVSSADRMQTRSERYPQEARSTNRSSRANVDGARRRQQLSDYVQSSRSDNDRQNQRRHNHSDLQPRPSRHHGQGASRPPRGNGMSSQPDTRHSSHQSTHRRRYPDITDSERQMRRYSRRYDQYREQRDGVLDLLRSFEPPHRPRGRHQRQNRTHRPRLNGIERTVNFLMGLQI